MGDDEKYDDDKKETIGIETMTRMKMVGWVKTWDS